MPSPFPGMNPYLEQTDVWHDFHQAYVNAIRNALTPQIRPAYLAKVDENVYIHELSAEERYLLGRPDVAVLNGGSSINRAAVASAAKPIAFGQLPPTTDRISEPFILPQIPVPLRQGDADAVLDLQQLLHEQFDAAGYEDYIYTGQPRPPLHPDDASWAGQYVDVP